MGNLNTLQCHDNSKYLEKVWVTQQQQANTAQLTWNSKENNLPLVKEYTICSTANGASYIVFIRHLHVPISLNHHELYFQDMKLWGNFWEIVNLESCVSCPVRAREALRQCLPVQLKDSTFSSVLKEDGTTKKWLLQLLSNLGLELIPTTTTTATTDNRPSVLHSSLPQSQWC